MVSNNVANSIKKENHLCTKIVPFITRNFKCQNPQSFCKSASTNQINMIRFYVGEIL